MSHVQHASFADITTGLLAADMRRAAGARVDSIDHAAGRVRALEAEIAAARERARAGPPSAAFFVFFTSQKAAAIAAQANLHPEDGHSFHVVEAPGPEEARAQCWTCARIWLTAQERIARGREVVCRLRYIRSRDDSARSTCTKSAVALCVACTVCHMCCMAACVQVNWPTLWMPWTERDWREVLVLPLIVGIMLVPVGIFSGVGDRRIYSIALPCCRAGVLHMAVSKWPCRRRRAFIMIRATSASHDWLCLLSVLIY